MGVNERVGFFGSAFDPPHRGHQAVLDAAFSQLGLSGVVAVPTGHAWHKTRALTDARHRLAMAQLAFADQPRVAVDARELQRPGPSYTIDTLLAVQAERPGVRWVLLIGADQAMAFAQWHRWRDLLDLAEVHVATRQAQPAHGAQPASSETGARAPETPQPGPAEWPPGLHALPMPPVAISATAIRDQAALGQPLDGLVTPSVASYIATHHLYRTP